jgi:hypothetical protein
VPSAKRSLLLGSSLNFQRTADFHEKTVELELIVYRVNNKLPWPLGLSPLLNPTPRVLPSGRN